jgi:hypothetical protein
MKGMLGTKKNFEALCQIQLLETMESDSVLALLDFSSRLLMPWIGLCCAHYAAYKSENAELLMELVSREMTLVDTEDQAVWREVVDHAMTRIVKKISDASIGETELEQFIPRIHSGPWCESSFSSLLVKKCEESEKNAQGHYLALKRSKEKELGAFVYFGGTNDLLFKVGTEKVWMVAAEVTAKARDDGNDIKRSMSEAEDPTYQRYRPGLENLYWGKRLRAVHARLSRYVQVSAGNESDEA